MQRSGNSRDRRPVGTRDAFSDSFQRSLAAPQLPLHCLQKDFLRTPSPRRVIMAVYSFPFLEPSQFLSLLSICNVQHTEDGAGYEPRKSMAGNTKRSTAPGWGREEQPNCPVSPSNLSSSPTPLAGEGSPGRFLQTYNSLIRISGIQMASVGTDIWVMLSKSCGFHFKNSSIQCCTLDEKWWQISCLPPQVDAEPFEQR